MPLIYPLILAFVLFLLGACAFFMRRSLISAFMAIELMLNACNMSWVVFAKWHGDMDGQVMVLFVMAIAAAEAAIGLALMIAYIRRSSDKSGLLEELP